MSNYNHTFNVLKTLPSPLEGYENPTVSSLLSDETGAVTVMLQNNSLSSGRLYEIEQNAEPGASTVLEINDSTVLSVFVGSNVNEIGFNGCKCLKAVEFANPTNIKAIKAYCFEDISSEISVDLSSFTNLSSLGRSSFNAYVKFPNNRVIIPPAVCSVGNSVGNVFDCNGKTKPFSFNEFEWKASNDISVGSSIIKPYSGNQLSCLSSITLNDKSIELLKSKYLITFESNDNTFCRMQYAKLSVDTLSTLHNVTSLHGFTNSSKTWTALSSDVYTFSNFALSDLEDQDSHAFDEYLSLLPNESFAISLSSIFARSGLSVWVPTALYETWRNEWPNYASCVYSYGPWEDRRATRELTFLPNRSYVIAPQTHKGLSVLNQSGPTTVNLSAYDVDVIEIPDNQNN